MSGGGGSSKSSSRSSQKETETAKSQGRILNQREAQYQNFFFPALAGELAGLMANTGAISADASAQIGQLSSAFDTQQGSLNRNLAQRGANSGLAALAQADFSRNRAVETGRAIATGNSQRKDRLSSLIQIGGGMSPTPTSAAPILSSSRSKSSSWKASLSAGRPPTA